MLTKTVLAQFACTLDGANMIIEVFLRGISQVPKNPVNDYTSFIRVSKPASNSVRGFILLDFLVTKKGWKINKMHVLLNVPSSIVPDDIEERVETYNAHFHRSNSLFPIWLIYYLVSGKRELKTILQEIPPITVYYDYRTGTIDVGGLEKYNTLPVVDDFVFNAYNPRLSGSKKFEESYLLRGREMQRKGTNVRTADIISLIRYFVYTTFTQSTTD